MVVDMSSGLKMGEHFGDSAPDAGAGGDPSSTTHGDSRVDEALRRIREFRRPLPSGFVFDRQDANGDSIEEL